MYQLFPDNVPRLRAADPPGPRAPARIELLTDLAFVVILGHLVRRLLAEPSLDALGNLLLLLVPVWWLWHGLTFYANRFSVDNDPVEFLVTAVELLGLLIMGAAIETALLSRQATLTFVGTYFGIRVLLHLKYIRARYYVPVAHPFIFHVQIGICLGLVCWVGAGLTQGEVSYCLWALALAVEILSPLVADGLNLQKRFPPDARHLPGRVATFTTLMLAQVGASIVMGMYQAGIRLDSVGRTLLAGITLLGLWASYFDFIYYSPAQALSERQRPGPFWSWLYLHLPLTLLLLLSGVGLALTVNPKPGLTLTNWLLGIGVGGCYIITGLLAIINRWASGQVQPNTKQKVIIRLITGIILVLTAPWLSPLHLLVLCSLTSLVIIIADQAKPFVHIDNPPTSASRFAHNSLNQGKSSTFELAAHKDGP